MKHLQLSLTACLVLLLNLTSWAQNYPRCYTKEYMDNWYKIDPLYKQQADKQDQDISDFIKQKHDGSIQTNSSLGPFRIPVVVHVVHDPAIPETRISADQVHSQIAAMNKGFADNGVNIEFCLAQLHPKYPWAQDSAIWPSGFEGITYFEDAGRSSHILDENNSNALLSLVNFPPDSYLNIWIVKEICLAGKGCTLANGGQVAGYSPYPLSQLAQAYTDGIIMRYDFFGDNTNPTYGGNFPLRTGFQNGAVAIHEAGHFLNLRHVFLENGGCQGINLDTINGGDLVGDTPPSGDISACDSLSLDCFGRINSAYDNIMNYGGNTSACLDEITFGQTERMYALIDVINTNRKILVSEDNLLKTGVKCLSKNLYAIFNADKKQICAGDTVTYSIVTGPKNTAKSWSWQFEGGIASTTSGPGPIKVVYNTVGDFDVLLTVQDSGGVNTNVNSKTQYIYVTTCTPTASTNGMWYFPGTEGVDFSRGYAQGVAKGKSLGVNNCAGISSPSGRFLFYTDGFNVFNYDHDTLAKNLNQGVVTPYPANGVGDCDTTNGQFRWLFGGGHTAVIVPFPGDTNRYYLFIASDVSCVRIPQNDGFSYTVVNMALNGGKGGIEGAINRPVEANRLAMMPFITAIPHCNGRDYWLIGHSIAQGKADKLFSYLITSSGISSRIESNSFPTFEVGAINYLNAIQWASQVEVSYTGRRVAIKGGNKFIIYDFDRQAGTFTRIADVLDKRGNGFDFNGGGLAFSKNDKYLYSPTMLNRLAQIDLSNINNPSPYFFLNTSVNGKFNNRNGITFLQQGPDDRIYLAKYLTNSLSVINYPDQRNLTTTGLEMGYNDDGVSLPRTAWGILPNLINVLPETPAALFDYSIDNCYTVHFKNLSCGTSFFWGFGDSLVPIASNRSFLENPSHNYNRPGNFRVNFRIQNGRGFTTYTKIIHIPAQQKPFITGPKTLCISSSPLYETPFNDSLDYDWTFGGGAPQKSFKNSQFVQWLTPGPHTIILTVTNKFTGCTGSDTMDVNVTGPNTNAGPDRYICFNSADSVQLAGSGGIRPKWHPSDGLSNDSILNPWAKPDSTTTYLLVSYDSTGCANIDSMTVYVLPEQFLDAGNDKLLCPGDSVQLLALVNPNVPAVYKWSPATDLSNSNIRTPIASPSSTTLYHLTATIGNCINHDSVLITVLPSYTISAGPDQNGCINGPAVTLSASSGAKKYTWYRKPTMTIVGNKQTITVPAGTQTTEYVVEAINQFGCKAKDSVRVIVNPAPVADAGKDTTFCGTSGNSIALGGGGCNVTLQYAWSPAIYLSSTTACAPLVNPPFNQTFVYTLTVTDTYGCTATDNVSVTKRAAPEVDAGTSQTVCDTAIQLFATYTGTDTVSYKWSPSTGLSNDTIPNPTCDPSGSTLYTVTVKNKYGCVGSDTVTVHSPYDLVNPVIAPGAAVVWNATTKKIKGTVLVENGATLTIINSTVKVGFGYGINRLFKYGRRARIVVAAGGTLTIRNSKLDAFNCHNQTTWEGLDLHIGQVGTPRSVLNLDGDTIIAAEKGVYFNFDPTTQTTPVTIPNGPPIVTALNTRFENNLRAIYCNAVPTGATSAPIKNLYQSSFKNCTFLNDAALETYWPFTNATNVAIVDLTYTMRLSFSGCSFLNGRPLKVFNSYKDYGILCTNSTVELADGMSAGNNYFYNFFTGADYKTNGGLTPSFPMRVIGNTFKKVVNGVDMESSQGAELRENTILLNEYHRPHPNDPFSNSTGINLLYCSGFTVSDNSVSSDSTFHNNGNHNPLNGGNSHGITIINSGPNGGTTFHNSFMKTGCGMHVGSDNQNLRIRCNTFEADVNPHPFGGVHFEINTPGGANYLGPQGLTSCNIRPGDAAGNKWQYIGNCSDGLDIANIVPTGPRFKYYANPNDQFGVPITNPQCAFSDWKNYDLSTNCLSATGTSCDSIFAGLISNPENIPGGCIKSIQQIQILIRQLEVQIQSLQALIASKGLIPLPSIRKQIEKWAQEADAKRKETVLLTNEMVRIVNACTGSIATIEPTLLLSTIPEVQKTLFGKQLAEGRLIEARATLLRIQIQLAVYIQNDPIHKALAIKEFQEFIKLNTIVLSALEQGRIVIGRDQQGNYITQLTNGEISKVREVANTFTTASAEAHGLLKTLFNEIFPVFVASHAAPSAPRRAIEASEDQKMDEFLVYPNPSTGAMTIEYMVNSEGNWNLCIFDMNGRSLKQYSLNPQQHQMDINCNELANGLYFIAITKNGATIHRDKITILK